MAMNFKVLPDREAVAVYAADILRKQFNNNPTTIAGVHLAKEEAPVLDQLKIDVDKHAVDFSQINILDYDANKTYYEALGVPEGQIYTPAFEQKAEPYIKEHMKTKDNKGKLITQVVTMDRKGDLEVSIEHALLPAREIFLIITGSEKADAVKKLYEENSSTNFEPADLKTHRMVNVVLDEAAAAGLPEDVKNYFTARFA